MRCFSIGVLLLVFCQAHAQTSPPAKQPGGKHVQSEEIKEFRKTAITVTFPSDGRTLHGWIYKPKGDGPFPAILWNHGSEKNPIAHPELGKFYTDNGYVLFLPVRHGHGQSPGDYISDVLDKFAKKAGDDKEAVRKKAVELHDVYNADVVAAIDWLKAQPYVDRERIAVTGVSYGGIQTLVTSEKKLGVRGFISFAPAAMSWANTDLQKRLIQTVHNAQAPLFLLQAKNDYSIGPCEVLGPIIRAKGGVNQSKIYPAFGTTNQDGHGGFACWEEGIATWGPEVLAFLKGVGMKK